MKRADILKHRLELHPLDTPIPGWIKKFTMILIIQIRCNVLTLGNWKFDQRQSTGHLVYTQLFHLHLAWGPPFWSCRSLCFYWFAVAQCRTRTWTRSCDSSHTSDWCSGSSDQCSWEVSDIGPSPWTYGSLQWGQGEDVSSCPISRLTICWQELYLQNKI